MKIAEKTYKWNGSLSNRPSTKQIILHHRAGNGDVESIHRVHLANGWTGIGYHFYVRKDGTIYRGRPINAIGAHCTGYNSQSIGVCFEGNFQSETMSVAQLTAGRKLISYLKGIYPNAEVKKHSDFMATACPGQHFPFDEIKNGVEQTPTGSSSHLPQGGRQELTSANDIIWELSQRIEINEVSKAVNALQRAKDENSSLYWILRKLVNK